MPLSVVLFSFLVFAWAEAAPFGGRGLQELRSELEETGINLKMQMEKVNTKAKAGIFGSMFVSKMSFKRGATAAEEGPGESHMQSLDPSDPMHNVSANGYRGLACVSQETRHLGGP